MPIVGNFSYLLFLDAIWKENKIISTIAFATVYFPTHILEKCPLIHYRFLLLASWYGIPAR